MPIIGQPQIFSNTEGVQRCKLRNKPEDTHTHTHAGDFKDVLKQTLNYRDEALTAQMVARYIPTLRRGHGAAASLQKNIHRLICSCCLSFLLSDIYNAHKPVPHLYQTISFVDNSGPVIKSVQTKQLNYRRVLL